MPETRYKNSILVEYLLRCEHESCQKDQKMTDVAQLNLGDVIYPSVGHRNYGRCCLCGRKGLRVINRSDLGSSS